MGSESSRNLPSSRRAASGRWEVPPPSSPGSLGFYFPTVVGFNYVVEEKPKSAF
jgi:hypothetical protein